MSWIISLGAGREQLPLIRAIQAEGYHCLAFDVNADAAGRSEARAFLPVSNRDVDGMLMSCRAFPAIAGVMAAGSEVPDVMAILAHRLGLPGVPVATGMLLKDKLAYKRVLKAAGVPHTETIIDGAADMLPFPCVVKPRVSSGSRNVFLVRSFTEFKDRFQDGDIIERYQPGPQISSETLIWDDRAVTVAFVDRFYSMTVTAPKFDEYGGSSPSHWISEEPACTKIIQDAARALGIRRGTIKGDLVLTTEGPKIIELTCRLSGGPLSRIVIESEGVDYLRQAVRIAAGKEPEWACMTPSRSERVAVDMKGNRLPWEDTRCFIKQEIGKVKR